MFFKCKDEPKQILAPKPPKEGLLQNRFQNETSQVFLFFHRMWVFGAVFCVDPKTLFFKWFGSYESKTRGTYKNATTTCVPFIKGFGASVRAHPFSTCGISLSAFFPQNRGFGGDFAKIVWRFADTFCCRTTQKIWPFKVASKTAQSVSPTACLFLNLMDVSNHMFSSHPHFILEFFHFFFEHQWTFHERHGHANRVGQL